MIRFKSASPILAMCAVGAFLLSSVANAATVTLDFPSTTSVYGGPDLTGALGAGGGGGEFHAGDSISQTFTGTGLSSVNEAIFNVTFSDRTTQGTITNFDLFINGTRSAI